VSDDVKDIVDDLRESAAQTYEQLTQATIDVLNRAADALEAAQQDRDLWKKRCAEETIAWVDATRRADAALQVPAVGREELADHVETFMDGLRAETRLYADLYKTRLVESIIASGILQDAAEVEARGLEKAADEIAGGFRGLGNVEWIPRTALVARAQQVREGNA